MWGRKERRTVAAVGSADRQVDRILSAAGAELVRETQSFLTGIWAWEKTELGLAVPGWAWLSVLAHAPAAAIRDWAAGVPLALVPAESAEWRRAVSLLARELLGEAERRGCDIQAVQRSLLVPLELDSARPGAPPLRSPQSLVGAVHRSLGIESDDAES